MEASEDDGTQNRGTGRGRVNRGFAFFFVALLSLGTINVDNSALGTTMAQIKQMQRYDHSSAASGSVSTAAIHSQTASNRKPYGHTKIIYYSNMMPDRSGNAILFMIYSFIYAYAKGGIYGGACGESKYKAVHTELLEGLGLQHVLKMACPTNESIPEGLSTKNIRFGTPAHAKEKWKKLGPSAYEGWDDYLHGEMRKHGRFENDTFPQPLIAVHIRRGDVDPCCHGEKRYLPNSYYEEQLRIARKRHPNGTVYIFSESQTFEPLGPLAEAFGAHLVLDGSLARVWRTMVHADYLILSRSTFSIVPEVLSFQGPNLTHIYPWDVTNTTHWEIRQLKNNCTLEEAIRCPKVFFDNKRK